MKNSKKQVNSRWGGFLAAGVTVAAVYGPVRVLFPGFDPVEIEWGLAAVFMTDLLVNLRRSGWIKGAAPENVPIHGEPFPIKWFIVDLLAVIPYGLLPIPVGFELLRLFKLARVAQLMRQWREAAVQHTTILRLVFFVFWLVLCAHWIACGWLALRGVSPELSGPDNYLTALYWCVTTLTTVGYGDVVPTTPGQKLYAMAVMILGAGVYGYVIANVASILANIDPAKVRYRELVERLSAFMRYRNIPQHLQERILNYNAYLWEKRLGYDESSAIAGLPPSLKAEVLLYLNREIIQKVPLFKGANDDFIRAVALEMRPVIFTPGDYIIRAGESGKEMFFISRGTVEVVSKDGDTVTAELKAGDFFGEIALLLNRPRTASVRAVDYCDLYVLEKDTFDHVLARFPDFAEQIETMARQRQDLT